MKTQAVEIKEDDKGHYTIECELPMMPIPIVERIVNEVVDKVREDKTLSKEVMDKQSELEASIQDTVEVSHKLIVIQRIKIFILWAVVIALFIALLVK